MSIADPCDRKGQTLYEGELLAFQPEPQLMLALEGPAAQSREQVGAGSARATQSGTGEGHAAGGEAIAGTADLERGWRRNSYSPAQRVYLDRLEQGAYNAYAGGLLLAPLLARYHFVPTLSRIITIATHEGQLWHSWHRLLLPPCCRGLRRLGQIVQGSRHFLPFQPMNSGNCEA